MCASVCVTQGCYIDRNILHFIIQLTSCKLHTKKRKLIAHYILFIYFKAKTQKMKHSVPKGDKKKKKEVTAEIAQLLADLDLKHEIELKEFVSMIIEVF